MFWGYALFGKLLKLRGMKQPRPGLLKGLFPEGVGTFLIACSRTSTLLASYAFMFWVLVGLGAVTRQVQYSVRPTTRPAVQYDLAVVQTRCCV